MTQPASINLEEHPEFLTSEYRKDLDILICRWFDFKDSYHLRNCYHIIFTKAHLSNLHYWLVDIRSRRIAGQEDYDWYFNIFLPDQVAHLIGHNYMAYLVTPSHFSYIQEMETLNKFESLEKSSSLRTRFFQSEQEAIEWLVEVRQITNN